MFESCHVELLETFGSDLTVVNAARVSLGKHVDEFTEKDAKLIKYLAAHEHTSPFFHPQARFRLKMPIWMAREWFRHTIGFSRNEVSRRYVDTPPEFHVPDELRSRAANKKQGSNEDVHSNNRLLRKCIVDDCERAFETYTILLNQGVCPEQARMVLPQNMHTEWIWTGSLMFFCRVCRERLAPGAQQETREVAEQIAEIVAPLYPVSWSALMNTKEN